MTHGEHPFKGFSLSPQLLESVFDALPDVLFFLKDTAGRYLWANSTLIERGGLKSRAEIIGETADHLFPVPGPSTLAQDLSVIRRGQTIEGALRMYQTSSGTQYWCLSSKFALYDDSKHVVGLFGLSRDLPRPNERHRHYYRLAKFLKFIERRFNEEISIAEAAKAASLSVDSLARLVYEIYHLTPGQLLTKRRIDHSCWLLERSRSSIAAIAAACGYADQSSFTRKFKAITHATPIQYRAIHLSAGGERTKHAAAASDN